MSLETNSLHIAQVFHHSGGGLELERDIFEMVKGHAYFLPAGIRTKLNDDGDIRSSEGLMLLDNVAIRHFRNWDCRVKILRLFYPNQHVKSNVFYFPLNDLYDQNPDLTMKEVEEDLRRILQYVINAEIIKNEDFELKVYFTRRAWYAFINFSDQMNQDQLALTHTWLRENYWNLPKIDQTVYVRYSKIDDTRKNFNNKI